MKNGKTLTREEKSKRIVITAIICIAAAVLLYFLLVMLLEILPNDNGEYETLPPVDPSKLYDVYPEDFDIMEYEEYLALDRSIYHDDRQTGVMQSVTYENAKAHGEAFVLMYDILLAIIDGDSREYNSYMGDERLKKGDFTQQQLYDIKISPYSTSESEGYEEHVFKVRYRIHENNGTYRNTIESDMSRAQYFYIDNSSGEYKVVRIEE